MLWQLQICHRCQKRFPPERMLTRIQSNNTIQNIFDVESRLRHYFDFLFQLTQTAHNKDHSPETTKQIVISAELEASSTKRFV